MLLLYLERMYVHQLARTQTSDKVTEKVTGHAAAFVGREQS